MEYYLFFDTETDGRSDLNGKWTNNQNIIELAYIVADKDFNILYSYSSMVSDIANKIYPGQNVYEMKDILLGKKWEEIYPDFLKYVMKVNDNGGKIISHNFDFDRDVIFFSGIPKKDLFKRIFKKNNFCTMKNKKIINYCKLPGMYGYKWPRLGELHDKLFPNITPYKQTHMALDDTELLLKCFKECMKKNII